MQITQTTAISKTSKVATAFVIALMIGVAVFTYYIDLHTLAIPISILVILIVICIVATFFMPTKIVLDDEALTVKFPSRSKSIALASIEDAVPFTDASKMWRLCGSGAFLGWWGWFSAKGTGKFMLYAANLDHLLLVTLTDGKKYVISCEDPTEIADKIQAMKSH